MPVDTAAKEGEESMLVATREKTKRKNIDRTIGQRLDYARFLLTQTPLPLGKVAADCGWINEKSFAAAFARRVGVTPARYRAWHQCRPAGGEHRSAEKADKSNFTSEGAII